MNLVRPEESPFTTRFRAWLEDKGLSGVRAAHLADYVVSVSYINNWKVGYLPSVEKCVQFFSRFPNEDVKEWEEVLWESRRQRLMRNFDVQREAAA